MNELISIIIPIYNCEKYVNKCLDSILNQTYKKIEIILINDGSNDNSEKICKEYERKDKRIIYIHQKNKGVSSARNKGISVAKGKYLCFVDSDDIIHNRFIETLYDGILNNADLSVVGMKKIYNYEDVVFNNDLQKYVTLTQNEAFKKIFEDENFFGFVWNKMYLKSIIDNFETLPFDEKLAICEDTLFNAKYLTYCKKIKFNRTKLYYYYQRNDSATKNKKIDEKKLSVFDALDKIENIYYNYSKENLVYLYIFYLYNRYIIVNLFKNNNIKYSKKNKSDIKKIKLIKKSKKISFIRKIKIIFKYKFPILNAKIYDLIKKR